MAKTINGIKAGTTTITASYTDGGVTKTASVNFTVNKIAGSSGNVSNPDSQVYMDGTQTNYSFQLGITGATGTVTYPTSITVKKESTNITGWTCNSSGVLTVPYTQGAGTYTVTGNITVAESTNYNAVAATSKTWTITITQKNDASVSVTLASNAGTYGEDAILVTAANSSSHGTSAAYVGYKYGSAATADSEITWVSVGKALTLDASASAGTYYIYKKWTADSNHSNGSRYTPVGTTYTLTRSKATPTFTLTGQSIKYHNTAYVVARASVAGTVKWGTSTSTMTSDLSVDANTNTTVTSRTILGPTTVYAYFIPTDTTNYNSVGSASSGYKNATAEITKADDAKVTAALTTGTLTYDGNAKTLATVSSSEGCTYYLGYKKSSEATADNQITWGSANSNITAVDAGTYYVYYKFTPDSNHSNSATYTKIGATRVIGEATITVSGTGNQTYVYDGSAKGSAISATTVNSQTATISYGTSSGSYPLSSAPQATNVADSKTVYWRVTAPNHTTCTGSYTLTINKRPIKVTAATDSKVYDSKPLTNNNATAEKTGTDRGLAPNQSMVSCTVDGSITNAGSTPNIPSGAFIKSGNTDTTANYEITYVNGTLTVTQKPVTITAPTLTTGTITYNGENQYLSNAGSTSDGTMYYYVSTSSTTPTFSSSTWSISRPTGQNATTYYLWYFVSVNANNYSGSGINDVIKIGTGSKAIAQKALTVTAASNSKEYDGNPLTINSATLSGNVGGHTLYSATYGGSQTTVGSSNSTVKDAVIKSGNITVTDNYAITYAPGRLSVTPASFTVGNKSNKTYTWTGSPQGTGVTVSDVKGGQTATIKYKTKSTDDYTLTSAPQITNVSESPITVYWQVTAPNHTDQDGSYTITINKEDAVLPTNWKGDSKVYHETARLTYTGYSGGTIKFRYDTSGGTSYGDVTTTAPTRTAVGNTSVQCMVEGDANHNSTDWSSRVTLTITQAGDARMEVDTFDRTYTGSGQVIAQLKANSAEGIATYSLGLGSSATSAPTSAGSTDKALSVTNAGTYYVWYKFTSDASHSNNKDWTYVGSVVVDKASRSGAVSCNDVTYGSTVQASVSGNTESGTVTWGITTGTGAAKISSTGVVTPTQAGTVTVTASVAATANYKAYTATSKTITISKANGSITYSTVKSVSEYCTSTAAAMSQTDANKSVVVATSSASSSTNTGVTIGYTINSVTKGDSSFTGWTVSTDGQTVTVPKGTVAGTYSVKITATAPTTTNYNTVSIQNTVSIVITATVLTDLRMTLTANSVAYNSSTTVASVTAEYNNGATKSVLDNATYTSNPTGIVTIS